MNDDQIRELLHAMREDQVPADALARVRQAVEARTSGRGARPGWGALWKLTAAVAVAGLIAALLLRPARHMAEPAKAQAVAAVERAAPALPLEQKQASHRRAGATARAIRHVQPKPATEAQAAGASLIRIETSDPAVVILLVADGGSESSRSPNVRE